MRKGRTTRPRMQRVSGFERMEDRRLLASDLVAAASMEMPVETDPVPCMMATTEYPQESVESQLNVEDGLEWTDESAGPVDSTTDVASGEDEKVAEDLGQADPDPAVFDLSDSMDGFFGSLNAENPTQSIQFTAPSDGIIDIVVASSFGDAETIISLTDGDGNIMDSTVEGLGGFNKLTFEAAEGESYQLQISSSDPNPSGQFQVTVGIDAFEDEHANQMGSQSTEINLEDGTAELEGRFEDVGDTDTFRFTAQQDGEVLLTLNETVDNARVGLDLVVQNASGSTIADGSTNQSLVVSFDVESGNEYFLAVTGDAKGTYSVGFELNASEVSEPVEPAGSELPVEVIGEADNDLECVTDSPADATDEPDALNNGIAEPDLSAENLGDVDSAVEIEIDAEGETEVDVEIIDEIASDQGEPGPVAADDSIDEGIDAIEAPELVASEENEIVADSDEFTNVEVTDPSETGESDSVSNENEPELIAEDDSSIAGLTVTDEIAVPITIENSEGIVDDDENLGELDNEPADLVELDESSSELIDCDFNFANEAEISELDRFFATIGENSDSETGETRFDQGPRFFGFRGTGFLRF
ncbi:MAG: hypothetical protein AAF939_15450 [Planctomycetota bacterium]